MSKQAVSEQVVITLPDGARMEVPKGTTVYELAKEIGPGLAKATVAGRVDGVIVDQRFPLERDARVEIVTRKDRDALHVLRHSAAHLMAMAVQRVRPGTALAFGPPVEGGFYYDFDTDEPFREDDFGAIEEAMREIVEADLPYERYEVDKEQAKAILAGMGEELKVEHVDEIPEDRVSFYRNEGFQDLCEGPHVRSTGEIGAFRLLKTSSSYWKGDAANKPLSRIYGTAFFDQHSLEEHLLMLEEAARRDHRRVGVELDLFSFHAEAPGFIFWHEKGATLYACLLRYFEEQHLARGYHLVRTPFVMSEDLWHRSGHWDHYKDNMFFIDTADEGRWALKPMNCPGHNLIFRTGLKSYRDLPIRMSEAGMVHRNELSGVIGGLTRVRAFAVDDAHIYCAPDQLGDEIVGVMDLVFQTYRDFGFSDFQVELSTRPESGSIGSDEIWEKATDALRAALESRDIDYHLNPGDGAFYGPKIDFHLRDSMKRSWQCGTIQVDFAMPERFDLSYVGADGEKHRPVMVHRAVFGSFERFIAVLIEHHAGRFPVWLSPVQVVVLNITDAQTEYATRVHEVLVAAGIRARLDLRNEKVGKKIREATLERIPYMAVIGDREVKSEEVSVRERTEGDLGSFPLAEFVDRVVEEIREKR